MESLEEKSTILGRYLASAKEYGDEKRIKKAIAMGRSWLENHPDDTTVRRAYLSLLREKCENKEELIEAIEDTVSWLKNHPEDKNIHSIYICLVRDKGFFRKDYIKQALEDAEEWMKKYDPHPLFVDYLTLVKKVIKSEISVVTNIELTKQLGQRFINTCKWEDNIIPIDGFARWLSEQKFFEESEQIYENLSTIEIQSKKVKADVYFGYGMLFLSQVMNLELTNEERAEKLKRAEEKFMEALKHVKGHIARAFLAITLGEQKRFEEAEREFKHVEWWARKYVEWWAEKKVQRDMGFSPGKLFVEIGKFYLEFNRYEGAKFWYEKATKEAPENFANWWRLGYAKIKCALILKEKGLPKESRKLFNEALSDLEISLKKAPKLLQPPASEDIPNLIEECKKHLQSNNAK